MAPGTSFQPIIHSIPDPSKITRTILCTGKHYYSLLEALSSHPAKDTTSIIRIEELSPFPYTALHDIIRKHTDVVSVVWAQEEPENQGAWTFVRPRLEGILKAVGKGMEVEYAGRRSLSTVAVGVGEWHRREVGEIVNAALGTT
jgi:probable 2-oxoglutarate dehydrogenase E1 component DHKTD1